MMAVVHSESSQMTTTPPLGRSVIVFNILSPCLYWVKNVPISKQDFNTIEWHETLSRQCNKIYTSHVKYQLDVNKDDFVAVLNKDGRTWDRGQVKSHFQTSSKFLYKVFLIDKGQDIQVESNKLLPLSENFSSRPKEAYQIGVYGIFPKCDEDNQRCQKGCNCSTTKYVSDLLKNYAIHFDRVVELNGIAFGHVYLDCDDEGFVNLAERLLEEDKAVRSKRFTKDILRLYSHNFHDCLSGKPEVITNENACNIKDNYKPKLEMEQSSKDITTQKCPENGFPSSDVVTKNIAFLKECKNRSIQYYPAGMPIERNTRKKGITHQRISKMNVILDRMKENHSGRFTEKGRQANNFMENTPRKEIQNTINNEIEEKSKSDNKWITKSEVLNDNKIKPKLNESDNSNKLVGSNASEIVGESFKHNSFINNKTSKIVGESSTHQLNMSKFIEKITKMKHTTENNKTNDNTVVLRTDNDESGLTDKPDILEYNGDTKSNESICNSSDFDHSHLTTPNTKENIVTAESKYKNKSLRLFDKLKNLNSKNLKNIDTVNSDKNILADDLTNTDILGSDQNTSEEIITINEIMESNNENTEKDSTNTQIKCGNHSDLSNNETSNTIQHKSTVESKPIKNLKFIDKLKNLNFTSLQKIETINIGQNNNSELELSLENKDNKSVPIRADISTDLTKVLKSDENTDAKEIVTNSQPKIQAISQELLNKLKVLNSTFNNTEVISTPDIIDPSIADSFLSDDGNLVGLNVSLSESNYNTQISEALSNPQLMDNLGKYFNKLSVSQRKSLNLLDKIKHLNLFKSLDISEVCFSEKEVSSLNISISNTSRNSEKLEKKQQMEENIDIHDSITLIKSLNYKQVEEDQLLEETIKNGDQFVNNNNSNKKSDIKLYESDLLVEEQFESEPLSLPERLKFLRRLRSNTSSNSINSPNTSLNNCSLDENISGDIDSNDYFNLNNFSSSYVSDSHISFKCRTSLDINASPMILNSTRDSDVSFEQQNRSSIQRYLNHVNSGSVLIHGKKTYKPVKTFYEADFDEVIFKNLENCGLRDLSRIQKYAFPVIMDRQNAVMISSPRTGKSLAYIVPLLCLLQQYDYYQKLHKGNGPCAVIIVAGWKRAQKVSDMCKKLLGSPCELNVQVAYVGRDELKMKASLTNGCDLLISTPRCFLRLLKEKYVTNINRLCHLVLDETDILFETFMPEVQELAQLVKKMLTVRKSSSVDIPVHTIVLSHKWTPPLEELVLNVLQNPVICIASHLEAAIYSRVKPIAIFLKPENKTNKLFELLDLKPKKQKTVIVCAKQEEVEEITLAAKTKGVNVISAHQGIPQIHCADLQQLWASKPASHEPILVCTDDVLNEIAVIDAQNLIHFSLPSSKTDFSFRFSCLHNAYRNIFDPDDLKTCQVHIFVDETNDIQLPEVFWFLQRILIKVPPSLEATVARILEEREMNKKGVFFCENLKQFGHCWTQHTCPERHILKKEEDLCQNIPQSGKIKMTILHIHNAGHYSVRILEHSNGDVWTKLQQSYIQIGIEINNYFNNEETRRLHGFPNVGDVASLETHTNSYQRVKVLKITEYDKNNDPSSVLVRLMDEGDILECQVNMDFYSYSLCVSNRSFSTITHLEKVKQPCKFTLHFKVERQVMELFTLPEKLKTYPAQAVDVYACRMLPVDLDRTWNDAIKKMVASWIKTLSETHVASYFVGKIVLSLGNNIWLDPLECAEWLPLCDTTVEYMSMRQRLLIENLAVDNPEHLMTLYKLCEKAGISYLQSKPEHAIQVVKNTIKPQWAHLSQDDYTCVNLVAACTLDKIFIRIVEFHDRLEMLSRDIEADITNSKYSLPPGSLKVDDFCLGRLPANGKWGRAMVVNKSDKELELFFVDYGDFADVGWDDVKNIYPELIRRLPFQTIECYLAGVEPLDGQNWEEKATDFLFDITEIDGVDKNLYVKVCDIDLKAKLTGGRRYKILLIDTTGPSDLIINQELINQGFANLRTDEKFLLENVYVDEKSQSALEEEVDSNTFNYFGSNNNKSVDNTVISYSSNSRTEEENERINQILLDLESDNFEYVGRHLNNTNQDNVKTIKTNKNKISIEEVSEEVPTDTTVGNIGHEVKLNTSTLMCDDKVNMSCKDGVNELNNLPELLNHGRCPNIVWHQNGQYIWIRVTLTDVQKYRMVWKVRKLEFSTIHQDVFYCMNLDLYGGMESEHLYHSSKGRYIEIKLKKTVRGIMWPRLIRDKNKLPWIKSNLEHYEEVENTSIDEFNLYKSDQMLYNDDDDTSSTASSEAHEPDVIPYDPYDPFG